MPSDVTGGSFATAFLDGRDQLRLTHCWNSIEQIAATRHDDPGMQLIDALLPYVREEALSDGSVLLELTPYDDVRVLLGAALLIPEADGALRVQFYFKHDRSGVYGGCLFDNLLMLIGRRAAALKCEHIWFPCVVCPTLLPICDRFAQVAVATTDQVVHEQSVRWHCIPTQVFYDESWQYMTRGDLLN